MISITNLHKPGIKRNIDKYDMANYTFSKKLINKCQSDRGIFVESSFTLLNLRYKKKVMLQTKKIDKLKKKRE